jgi:hypothetical protein
MTIPSWPDPGFGAIWLAGLITAQVSGVILMAWAFASLPRRKAAAARHAIWLAALGGVLLGPAALISADRGGWSLGMVRAPMPAAGLPESAGPAPIPPRASGDSAAKGRAARGGEGGTTAEGPSMPPPRPSDLPATGATGPGFVPPNWLAWARIALCTWAAGSALLLGWLAYGLMALARLRRRAWRGDDARLGPMLAGIAGEVGLQAPPQLLITDRLDGPVAVGFLHPAILLPEHLIEVADEDRLRDILIHEAAHLSRRDPLVGLIQRIAAALFWPHPPIHLLNRELARAREEVCDNYVLRMGNRARYARTLLDLAESIRVAPRALVTTGLLPTRWSLADRVTGLLDEGRDLMVNINRWKLGALAALMLLVGAPFSIFGPIRTEAKAGAAAPPPASEGPRETPAPAPAAEDRPITDEEIAGVVVGPDDKPIEGATVDAYSWFPGHETTTNAEGRFRLRAFTGSGFDPKQGAPMRITKEGYGPKTFDAVKGGTAHLHVELDNSTYFEGTVKAPGGTPAPNITVRASNPMIRDGHEIGRLWTETRTDAEGRYRLYVEPATFDIAIREPGVGVARNMGVAIRSGQQIGLDLPLKEGVDFRGKVVDSITGEPVQGLRLFRWLRVDKVDIEGRSGPDGIVLIDDLPPGPLEFQVEVPGHARWWSEEAISEWNRQTIGEPHDRYGRWQRNFDGLDFNIEPGMGPVTIVAEKGVTVRGRVLDPEGKPVAKATVAPALTGSGNSLTGDTRFSVETKEDGTYEVLLPASGDREYNLIAHDGGYFEWRNWANGVNKPFRTRPGEILEGVDLSLTRPATVRGRVVDTDGKPVAGRQVRASAADALENRYYDPTAVATDADGRFELKFIRPSKQHIQVYPFWLFADQAPKGTSQTVILEPGEVREGIELIAQPQ